jgi:hypothetical protein
MHHRGISTPPSNKIGIHHSCPKCPNGLILSGGGGSAEWIGPLTGFDGIYMQDIWHRPNTQIFPSPRNLGMPINTGQLMGYIRSCVHRFLNGRSSLRIKVFLHSAIGPPSMPCCLHKHERMGLAGQLLQDDKVHLLDVNLQPRCSWDNSL